MIIADDSFLQVEEKQYQVVVHVVDKWIKCNFHIRTWRNIELNQMGSRMCLEGKGSVHEN
jgi:hypothetical protein